MGPCVRLKLVRKQNVVHLLIFSPRKLYRLVLHVPGRRNRILWSTPLYDSKPYLHLRYILSLRGFSGGPDGKVKVKVAQQCPTFCHRMDYTVHRILQARIVEWVTIPFPRASSQPRDQTQVSCIAGRFFTSWAPREAQEYWSGQPIPSPANLPDPGIKPRSSALQADSLPTVRSLGWEDALEKGMATHFSILAWEIPWTEGPGAL